ncbi:hypothetical protein QBC34DRAFT_476004 [Podospora aff. communis PSN243]|uniref:Uncharacterized protein n=1 Tax=Podospora aff. communis PSN243 TaxID=3040156 RepID=A0AAV9G6Q1_9PEZI|nr:hypothetical protein QBC34DRAFT_476004 [Podospora aff. communis PSN243]
MTTEADALRPTGPTQGKNDAPDDADADAATRPARHGRRAFLETQALSAPAIVVLVLGTALVAGAVAVLAFLWRGSMLATNLDEPGQVWRDIVLSGWAPRAVTICAAALRVAITAQAALVASMVAALLLEKYGVPLYSAPFLSMTRAVSIQPVQLLYAQGPALVRASNSFALPVLLVIGLIAMATTFTSTILLSDFDTVTMLAGPNTSTLAFSLVTMASGIYKNIWSVAPTAYPRFAEYSEPPASGEAFVDTGVTMRALLPFQDRDQRTALRQYSGPASVFDARAICVRPTLRVFNVTAYEELFMTGAVRFDGQYPPGLRVPEPNLELAFSCALAGYDYNTLTPWDTSICKLLYITNQFGNADQPLEGWPYLVSPLPGGTRLDLILNMTRPRLGWRIMTQYNATLDTKISDTGVPSITPDGPWAKATFADAEGAEIAITACFTGLEGYEYQVNASSSANGPEPVLAWAGENEFFPSNWDPDAPSSNTTAISETPFVPPSYATLPIRAQLGAALTPLSPLSRGILSLSPNITWAHRFPGNAGGNYRVLFGRFPFPTFAMTQNSNSSQRQLKTRDSLLMVYKQALGSDELPHHAHVALFLDTLIATKNPALALQAWYTSLYQLQYMDAVSRFSGRAWWRYA